MTLVELIEYARTDATEYAEIEFGFFPNFIEQRIQQQTKVAIKGARKVISIVSIRHIIKSHSDHKAEKYRTQLGVTDDDICKIPWIVANYDSVMKAEDRHGPSVIFIKLIDNVYYHVAMTYKGNKGAHKFAVKTMYKRNNLR